jgi:hypothetical protein
MDLTRLTEEQKDEHKKWIEHFEGHYRFIFLKPSYDEVPFASQFFHDHKVSEEISRLEYYLLGTYPIDMGTNNLNEMHKIRYSFSKEEYAWHQRHNKLGLNCWGTQAGIAIAVLNSQLGRDDLHVMKKFPKKYSAMPFSAKVRLCTSVDKRLHELLKKLYSEYS